MRNLMSAVFLFLPVACVTPPPAPDPVTGESIMWRCAGGVSFVMRPTEGGNAEVVAGGRTYWLPAKMSASGARYSNEKVEFWEHGAEAMLNGAAGGPYNTCVR